MNSSQPISLKDEIARRVAAGEEIDAVLFALDHLMEDPDYLHQIHNDKHEMDFMKDEAKKAVFEYQKSSEKKVHQSLKNEETPESAQK